MSKGPQDLYSARANALLDNEFPFEEPKTPVRWNFDQGTPAPELYPLDDLKAYVAKAVETDGILTCEYFGPAGYEEMTYGYAGLRSIVAERTGRRDGRPLTKANIMLVNGSAHGLSLIAQAYVGDGDGVVAENLSFPFMIDYIGRTGATVAPVPVDRDGMVVDEVPKALQSLVDRGLKPKMIYTIPSFQVPTGTCLPLERRQRLLQIAQEWGVMIVEDNCYHELYFDTPPPPTLFSMDDTGLVMQSDSFSKVMAPGLRLGWVNGTPEALAPVAAVRQDLGSSQLLSHALSLYLADGKLEERLSMLRPKYLRKRNLTLAALEKHCTDHVSFGVPEGGIYFWLEVDPAVDCAEVSRKLSAEGIACRPGERFTDDPAGKQFFRLSFLHVGEDEIERGIEKFGDILRSSVTQPAG